MTSTEMASKFDLHSNQITQWKTQMLEHAVDVFEAGSSSGRPPVDVNRLHAKIGDRTLGNDFLEGHKIYPYLLRHLQIAWANQVWAMDISYLPMATDFICLAAAVDWPTRSVLSWRLTFLLLASHAG
tara:strand:+ start:124 stop:504 length:381 start_codon:yes stop_codon:yes gene_type:complete